MAGIEFAGDTPLLPKKKTLGFKDEVDDSVVSAYEWVNV